MTMPDSPVALTPLSDQSLEDVVFLGLNVSNNFYMLSSSRMYRAKLQLKINRVQIII